MAQAKTVAEGTLRLAPSDSGARVALLMSSASASSYWINASLAQYRTGRYSACIADAQRALLVDPKPALAYNNIGAAYAALGQSDLAIQNEFDALQLDPKLVVAQNNLRAYTFDSQKITALQTPEDLLNASLHDRLPITTRVGHEHYGRTWGPRRGVHLGVSGGVWCVAIAFAARGFDRRALRFDAPMRPYHGAESVAGCVD